jgi:hypothetical protein
MMIVMARGAAPEEAPRNVNGALARGSATGVQSPRGVPASGTRRARRVGPYNPGPTEGGIS